MSTLNCFNAQGSFHPKLFYANQYNIIPSVYSIQYSSEDGIDIDSLTISNIKSLFEISDSKNIWLDCFDSNESTSAVDDEDDNGEIYRNGEW